MKQVVAPDHAAFSDAHSLIGPSRRRSPPATRSSRDGPAAARTTERLRASPDQQAGGGARDLDPPPDRRHDRGELKQRVVLRWNDREERFNRLPKVVATRRALMTKKRHATTRSLTTRSYMFIRSSVIGLQRRPLRHSIDQVGARSNCTSSRPPRAVTTRALVRPDW
jgi:hypothetical protein